MLVSEVRIAPVKAWYPTARHEYRTPLSANGDALFTNVTGLTASWSRLANYYN